jgi:hypothetical protein
MIAHFGWRILVAVASLATAGAVCAGPADNLLPNGSFEKQAEGKPVGWQSRPWAGKAILEVAAQGHTGNRSVMIASENEADFSLGTNVAVEPFAQYRLSGWIKTENVHAVSGRGALIVVPDLDTGASPALTGTHDWTRVEVVFNTYGQDHLSVFCCFGGWGQATGKAWFDDLVLQQIGRYTLDYSYLFRKNSPKAPRVALYGGQTAIAEQAFAGDEPHLDAGKEPVHWRLVCGPNGMTVDADSGAPSWQSPTPGHHRVAIEAQNSFGRDLMEFMLIVVKNDIPNGRVVVTKHIDFVLPPKGVRWFKKWKPQAMITAQYEAMRKVIGHEPTRDGKQVVKYQPGHGGGCSGNPVTVGRGFWENWDEVRGWRIGIWHHEVGHNFHGQAPITFYSNVDGYLSMYHHHLPLLNTLMPVKICVDPAAFGLSGQAAENYRRWWTLYDDGGAQSAAETLKQFTNWRTPGSKLRDYGSAYQVWWVLVRDLAEIYGPDMLDKTIRAMRTDGVPRAFRERAKTPLQVNALFFCIMSHAAGKDLRPRLESMGIEFDADFYQTINSRVAEIVRSLPDEDDLDGWKKNPHNGHYYRRTMLDANWHAAEVESRQCGGHLATIRNAQELQWLQSRFEAYPSVWIGLQNAKRGLDWKWISGDRARFTSWDQGQSAGRHDSCFALLATGSGKWQATNSPAQTYPGIIEVDPKQLAPRHHP